MLLGIYLMTTTLSFVLLTGACNEFYGYLNGRGYKRVAKEKSTLKDFASDLAFILIGFIPVVNFVVANYVYYASEELCKSTEKKFLESGKIYKPNIEFDELLNIEDEVLTKEEDKTHSENTEKVEREKTYDEMTVDEKLAFLESERAKLISQYMMQSAEGDSVDRSNQEQQGSVLKKTIGTRDRNLRN